MSRETNLSRWQRPGFVENTRLIIEGEDSKRLALDRQEYTGSDITFGADNVTPWLTSGNLTTHSANESAVDDHFSRDQEMMKMEIALESTILYLALFGNSLVLVVLKLRRQKLSRMQWFMVHLAVADLFVCFFNILPQIIWDLTRVFHGNDFICRSVKYSQVLAMYASSYVLIMCAVDRYMSICHPLTSQTLSPNRVHLMIALAWAISLLFSIPQIFIFSLVEKAPGKYDCYGEFIEPWGLKAYITWMFVSNYAVPLLILAFCYGRICHVVWARVATKDTTAYSTIRTADQANGSKPFRLRISFRRMRDHNNSTIVSRDGDDQSNSLVSTGQKPRGHQRGISKSKVKTIKMTLTVVFCYLLCWAPFYLVNIIDMYGSINFEAEYSVAIMLLASLNSCTNPWIYLAFSGRICPRKQMRRASKSWGPSTHVTSGGDAMDTRSRTSFLDLCQTRPNLPARQGSHRCTGNGQQCSNC